MINLDKKSEHLVDPKIEQIDETVKQPEFITNLLGMVQTVTVAPSGNPTRFIEQIKIFNDGGTRKLRIYDTSNATWYGVTLS